MKVVRIVLIVVFSLTIAYAADDQAGGRLAASCAACHGPNGNSSVPIYPKLAGQNAKYFIDAVFSQC